jgi:hypothetical protein
VITDPRIERFDACGITRVINGREWVCIARAHDTEKQRSRQLDRRGYPARSERHYMVPRYPFRPEREAS